MANRLTEEPVPSSVTNAFRAKGRVRETLSSREWVAVWFAVALFSLITLIAVSLLWQWLRVGLPAPSGPEAAVDYKTTTALVDDRITRFFDLTITKTLLPVFTTMIGFLLGRRTRDG